MKNRVFAIGTAGFMAVTGCVMVEEPNEPVVTEDGTLETPEESLARRRAALPPQVQTALPNNMDPGFLLQDDTGCWNIVVEQTEPFTGVPLRDTFGQPVCET